MHPILEMLSEQGFTVPETWPQTGSPPALREDEHLIRRLMTVKAAAVWVCQPEEGVSSRAIRECLSRLETTGGNRSLWQGRREALMLEMPREQAQTVFLPWVGWMFEGAWALAWLLGYEEAPDTHGTMMNDERVTDVLFNFLPTLEEDVDAWLSNRDPDRYTDEAVAVLRDALGLVEAASRGGSVPSWFSTQSHALR